MPLYTTFVSTSITAAHLNDPLWVIIDCSFDLAEPDWGEENYRAGHIPGALYAHQDRDLAGTRTALNGRHPLPDPEMMRERLSAWGIGAGRQVVVYDTAGGAFAARLWWLLQYYGHSAVAILDGGYAKWVEEDRPLTDREETPRSRTEFEINLVPEMLISLEEMQQIHASPRWTVIDARSAVRHRGEQEPIDPVAGHIPGSVNRFHALNLSPEGTILGKSELRHQFKPLMGQNPIERTVVYCGSGVTSTLHAAAMRHAGLGTPKLYAGSWSEWIRFPENPIATGSETP